jgi:circadian clock protein KaiC
MSTARQCKTVPTKRAPAKAAAAGRGGQAVAKAPTGIGGFDEITGGGLPRGRSTLVCGGPGCGKTLLATQFLAQGALEYGEPGVFVSFEESTEELAENSLSIGIDLKQLSARRRLMVDHVHISRSEITESGAYDLEGLFIRLGHAIDMIGARRVALDTIEVLFSGLSDAFVLRAELRRLFRWLKAKRVTAIVTGERAGGDNLTRHGLEEFVSDCVILLDQRVSEQNATRRLHILKYRGSAHGSNEFPFLIDDRGLCVLPITSVALNFEASAETTSTGVAGLDELFGKKGWFRGSGVLVSGTPGTGKSSLSSHFADAACRRGERCLYFAFEESPHQIARNMRSIGIDLDHWMDRGLLRIHADRPTARGLEAHLTTMQRLIVDWRPRVVVVDPMTNLVAVGSEAEVKAMLTRLIDFLKSRQITTVFTSLTRDGALGGQPDVGVSSLMDVWMLLENLETNGERDRQIRIVKARGMAHSNRVHDFRLTDRGIRLRDVSRGNDGRVLVGSARMTQPPVRAAEADAEGGAE